MSVGSYIISSHAIGRRSMNVESSVHEINLQEDLMTNQGGNNERKDLHGIIT